MLSTWRSTARSDTPLDTVSAISAAAATATIANSLNLSVNRIYSSSTALTPARSTCGDT